MVEIRPFGRLHTGFIMHIYVYLQYEARSEFTERTLAKSVSVLLHGLVQSDILDEDLGDLCACSMHTSFEGTSYAVPKSRL